MAKRKHVAQRSRINEGAERPGFTRRSNLPPPSARRSNTWLWLLIGGVGVLAVVVAAAWVGGFIGGPAAPPTVACPAPQPDRPSGPPAATPLANPPAQPLGDGTTATIETDLGDVVIELFCGSAPVASENFINLAESGYYDGIVFHRIIPGFMIQGGDPDGDGTGGPGYKIKDDPVVGDYSRGQVAMARPGNQDGSMIPDSAGSQFFILVEDSSFLSRGGYQIFGNVIQGMDVVDQIVSAPNDGSEGDGGRAIDPVIMRSVTIQRP
jgi:peptidyl-prolyl cis-trans isomerase B (cyclophilin B)